jgi:hypothetical protein
MERSDDGGDRTIVGEEVLAERATTLVTGGTG